MAAYAKRYVVSISSPTHGTFREVGEDNVRTIRMPFGTEYKINIRNQNDWRCVARIYIDGMEAVTDGLVIEPHGSAELERFVLDGDLNQGRRLLFKDVNCTNGESVQDPSSSLNGRIEVVFYKEKTKDLFHSFIFHNHNAPLETPLTQWALNNTSIKTNQTSTGSGLLYRAGISTAKKEMCVNDVGGTVAGSASAQSFTTTRCETEALQDASIQIQIKGMRGSAQTVFVQAFQKAVPNENPSRMVLEPGADGSLLASITYDNGRTGQTISGRVTALTMEDGKLFIQMK